MLQKYLEGTAGGRFCRLKKRNFERKNIVFSIIICVFLFYLSVAAARQMLQQQGIAEEVLRFHVLANSDEAEDQEVKLYVRDAVLQWMDDQALIQETSQLLEHTGMFHDKRSELEQFLSAHLDEIKAAAEDELKKYDVNYGVKVELALYYFPERTYGDYTFPKGWYQALRICLGEAKGHNWWCILYPKLCFSDCVHAVPEAGAQKEWKKLLTVEEYECLIKQPKQWKIKFRWLSWLNGDH